MAAGVGSVHVGAVGDEFGGGAVALPVDALQHPRVGDQTVGAALGVALGPAQVASRRARPLGTLRVEPVDVEDGGDAGQARQGGPRRVADDEVDGRVGPRQEHHVEGRQHRVDERVEVLGGDRRQMHERHAPVRAGPRLDGVRAAVDGDVVAPCGQTGADVLDRGLEAAVAGRHAARTQEGELHRSPRSSAACS